MKKISSKIKKFRKPLLVGVVLGIIIALFQGLLIYAAGVFNLVGTYGSGHTLGVFDTQGGGGNGGSIIFIPSSDESALGGSGVYIDTDANPKKITGNFFVQTVGWVTILNAELTPSNSLSGYAWSENAGYIDLTSVDGTYSGVSYAPGSRSFTGYAWSDTLGYLSFSSGSNLIFRNKVKILGNIAGNKAFDTEYALGTKFGSMNSADVINSIRKNVALTTRSLPSTKMNALNTTTNTLFDILYYKSTGATLAITDPNGKMKDFSRKVRSLIIEGGDLIIDSDIVKDPGVNSPRTIIVLKNDAGNGGNVYIKSNVKNIYTSIIAEGSIYSGDSPGVFYNDTPSKLISLPTNQLYIYGTIISRNTIGGSSKNPVSCPFTETNCTYDNALMYDWNYFRSFDNNLSNQSDKSGNDEFSVIIETDPRIISDPPPGVSQ